MEPFLPTARGEDGSVFGGVPGGRLSQLEHMARVARRRYSATNMQGWYQRAAEAQKHPITVGLMWLRRLSAVFLPAFLTYMTGAFAVWRALGKVYWVTISFPETHPIHIPAAGDEWRDYARTDESLTGWHRSLLKVYDKIIKHSGGAVGEIDQSALEFETEHADIDMVSELMLMHVVLVVVQYFYTSKHLAIAVFQLDAFLFAMAYRVKKIDDAMGAAVDMLEEAQLAFAMLPMAHSKGEAAAQGLVMQKMQTLITYWYKQNLGLSVGVPGVGVVTVNLSMVGSIVAASVVRGAPVVFSAPQIWSRAVDAFKIRYIRLVTTHSRRRSSSLRAEREYGRQGSGRGRAGSGGVPSASDISDVEAEGGGGAGAGGRGGPRAQHGSTGSMSTSMYRVDSGAFGDGGTLGTGVAAALGLGAGGAQGPSAARGGDPGMGAVSDPLPLESPRTLEERKQE